MAVSVHSSCIIKLSTSNSSGGIDINVNHNNFMSIEMERTWGDSANKFTLKILDDSAYEVESILLAGNRNIYIKYYIDDGKKPDKFSKEFEGSIWDYSIDFVNSKTVLTLSGTCGVSVKDIYTIYNRLWNRVPIITDQQAVEDLVVKFQSYTTKDAKGNVVKGYGFKDTKDIRFRYAKNDNNEYEYQINFFKNSDKSEDWIKCDLISVPTRPSDIVDLIVNGGSLSKISPFENPDIDYDDFASSGFNFGTTDGSNPDVGVKKITWSMVKQWALDLGNDFVFAPDAKSGTIYDFNTGIDFIDSIVNDMSTHGLNGYKYRTADSSARSAILSFIIIQRYFELFGEIEKSKDCDWTVGHIEPTYPICSDLSQVKMSNTKYISEVLAAKSISSGTTKDIGDGWKEHTAANRANYYLHFEGNQLYFEPSPIESNPKAKVVLGQYYNSFDDSKDTGTIYSGDMVLSYSYSSNTAAYIAGENANELAGINYTTGEPVDTGGLSKKVQDSLGVQEAVYTEFNPGAIPTLSGSSSTNIEDLVLKAQNDWTALAQTSFKAEVQILGNLDLKCGDYIEIINVPGGKMGKHHTSGVYLIMKIKESISKGLYISTLTLVKNAANSGSGVSVTKSK